jgi:CYTH domain-containing protein
LGCDTVHDVAASAQEVIATQEAATASIKQAEARAALARREAQEKVSKAEVEYVALQASAHGESDGFARKVALLEG